MRALVMVVMLGLACSNRLKLKSLGTELKNEEQGKDPETCAEKAKWPLYANRGQGLDWTNERALAKAEEICKQRGGDAEAARLHTDCLFATWSVGDVAKEGCESSVETLANYSACILNAKGWLPDEGVALCKAGKYTEAAGQVECIKQSYWPFYADRGRGLDWNKASSVAEAAKVCEKRGYDPADSRAHADCLFATWSTGSEGKAGCDVDAEFLGNYSTCISDAKGWLPDDGVALCTASKYNEAAKHVQCIKQAYWPFYADGGRGLNWNKASSVAEATKVCEKRGDDPADSRAHAECLFATWGLGSDAKVGCDAGMHVLANYTACISSSNEWLSSQAVTLCKAGEFYEATRQSECVKKAYYPFYASRPKGLDWSKSSSTSKGFDICVRTDFDNDAGEALAGCLVKAWPPTEQQENACDRCILNATALDRTRLKFCAEGLADQLASDFQCVERIYAVLSSGLTTARDPKALKRDAAELCKKRQWNFEKTLPLASCIAEVPRGESGELGMAATADLATCLERAWRNTSGCHDLFGPVEGQKAIVFIVDVSGSMDERIPGKSATRLGLMKTELAKVIKTLHADQRFTILAFDTSVKTFRDGLILGNMTNIQAALTWIDALRTGGRTNYEKPLRQALAMDDLEAVHLLSDGEPNEGCTQVSCLPLGKDIPVHTTLLMPGEETGEQMRARALLRSISLATGGAFREPFSN